MIQQGIPAPAKARKTRSDKKTAVLVKLDADTHKKLKRLALACDLFKTPLAEEIIQLALNHPEIVNFFQQKYGADEFRIIPVTKDGRVEYC
ncbi:hypothetical protein [Paenibacillus sp. 1P03SA]|uniref:hypothetical protein n=1 Tax=Paenibacillus sp. 1P03SA TaxID=3132294 RepID=UPI0039A2EED4